MSILKGQGPISFDKCRHSIESNLDWVQERGTMGQVHWSGNVGFSELGWGYMDPSAGWDGLGCSINHHYQGQTRVKAREKQRQIMLEQSGWWKYQSRASLAKDCQAGRKKSGYCRNAKAKIRKSKLKHMGPRVPDRIWPGSQMLFQMSLILGCLFATYSWFPNIVIWYILFWFLG